MNQQEIQLALSTGEDSMTQFKCNIHNPEKLASELVAFSNSIGGNCV
ncbi:MAG: hypothetical protein RBR15_10410 [Sphaerochaeta sp.]|nr:hypothetical protein [Sphaerochaeta sp.]